VTDPGKLGHVAGYVVIGSYTAGIWCRLGRPHGTERAALAEALREKNTDRDLMRVAVVNPRGDVSFLNFDGVKVGITERA
jgi:hypothetical protein